jgi:hypothetical protein
LSLVAAHATLPSPVSLPPPPPSASDEHVQVVVVQQNHPG